MSGFLHRLAAQAMGRTNTLRSAVRTPYAAPFSSINRVEPDRQDTTLDITGNERQHMGNSDGVEYVGDRSAERNAMPVPEQHHVNTVKEIGTQSDDNEAIASVPEVLVVQSDIVYTKPDRPDALYSPPSSPKAMLRQSGKEKTVASEPPVLADGIETRLPESHSTAFTDNNYPSPLLPLKNATRPSALNTNVAAQRGEHSSASRQSQVDEITEVHVSIGRIEVTAVHEAPPPKRQAPTSAKPLSLDEYLARRGKKI
ncbi:conserved hypothetical protein [Candidatus Nitrotoga sp. HW29]|uniref:hypothetical protein n=1 Tax=Candidatus Nitrotoga sp. HW29 TaxID=2886963 RepID=UPI001EF1650B|nr:hypothetical protein [Candidatus Nitrotoga sp. HW29]CAH1905563.1 conserved hypothetical protein [Candidatus Nitrotoga sp. HW29]